MATRPVGTVYPRARGKCVTMLNEVIEDLIDAVTQCWICEGTFPTKEAREQLSYLWKAIHEYSGDVIKFHKY